MRYAVGIPLTEIRLAHAEAKRALLEEVAARTGVQLEPDVLTVGFARRATGYKRAELLFTDLERLRHIDRNLGPLQLLFAGKAHPRDEGGKAIIRRIREASARLAGEIPVIYLEDYDMALAAKLCAGVDLWLNTPQKPEEASGTSGMKAALNGVPSLSVLDGWWIEGHVEGVTGWSIGKGWQGESDAGAGGGLSVPQARAEDRAALLRQPDAYTQIMRSAISLNGSFFNAQRMVIQYAATAYDLPRRATWGPAAMPPISSVATLTRPTPAR